MGYQIQYGQAMVKTYVPERNKFKVSRNNIIIVIAGLVLLLATIFGSQEAVQNFLLPGNGEVTRTAVSKMVTDLKDGEPLAASFEAFCREIVDGANIPK